MKKIGWFSGLFKQQSTPAMFPHIAGGIGAAILLTMTGIASAQNPTTATPFPAPETRIAAPDGYTMHQSVDVGGRVTGINGSGAMYDTLVNLQSGPRVLGESFEMRALPGKKHTLIDSLRAMGSGFGGDPNSFAKLDFSKGKIYEFSGLFRRDRQYFNYDLLGNPNIPGGQSIPVGTTGSLAWPQVLQSPVMFNTVRRMTDTSLTLFPLSKVTLRASYSHNIFQGPSLSPGGSSNYFAESIGANDALLSEFQRNSSDDFTGGIDWKPIAGTQLTFEEQVDHYKADTYFTLAASGLIVQEADGMRVAPGGWDSMTPYSGFNCAAASMGGNPLLSAPLTAGGLPVINAACSVASSYLRSEPTRVLFPTEMLRLQSSSIRNVSMNGNVRYTSATMKMPSYYENFQGLDNGLPGANGGARSITYTGSGTGKREVIAADYGLVWEATKTFSLADQINFSSAHQPGSSNISTGATLLTPSTPGNQTINYSGPLTPGPSEKPEGNPNGTPQPGYFGQNFLTNNLTASWEASSRTAFSVTYRHVAHTIAQGTPHNTPLAVGSSANGTVTINEDGGVFGAAVRPTANWELNGSAEVLYADNVFTAVGARQTRHYRVHTKYRPRPWATITGAYNDQERHNNTNNNQAAVTASDMPYEGPLDHVDYSRIVSMGAVLAPNKHYGLDFNYAYSDVYTATNICYDNGAQNASTVAGLAGTASLNSSGGPNVCPGVFTRGSTTQLADWFGRDFMHAPTQYGSVTFTTSPTKRVHSDIGYRISAVNGNQFFTDARSVNGSLQSAYQSPFVNVQWTIHPGLIWKAEYNFYGYGEGGPSGPQYCSTSTSLTSTVVPCDSLPAATGLTESPAGLTAPRNFHANNITIRLHYDF